MVGKISGRYGLNPAPENRIEFTLERDIVWPVQPRAATEQYRRVA